MTFTSLKTDLTKRLHQIGQMASERSAEIEAGRQLPEDIAQALIDSGVLRLWTASAYNGYQATIGDLLDSTETLAYYDGATGWVAIVTGTAALMSGFLPQSSAQEIFAPADAMVGGLAAPMGTAIRVDGGLRVTGRWMWGSGTRFCSWIVGIVRMVDENGQPAPIDGKVHMPLVYFPRDQVSLIDTWHVSGLKGTSSGEYEVNDVFVPDGYWLSFPPDAPVIDDPLYRFPFTGALAAGVASAALGMAQRALDEILDLAPSKTPQWSRKKLAEKPTVQDQVARAEANYRAARAFLRETVAEAWREAEIGNPSIETKRRLRMAATYATEQAAKTVDVAYHLGGGSSIWESVPLQRIFRDVHVATQHGIVSPSLYELFGKLAFRLPAQTAML